MSLIAEIADYLETQGHGTVATDIFIGPQPSSPNDCITLIQRAGLAPDEDIDEITFPTLQIIVRNASYESGETKAANVFGELKATRNTDLGDFHAFYILATSDVGYIGRDENERHEWSMNFRLGVRDDS